MEWFILLAYFAVCSAILVPFSDIYGKVLHVAGRAGGVVKLAGALVAWLFMAIVLVSPLFGGIKIGYEFLGIEVGDIFFITYTGFLYVATLIPCVLFFRNRHLKKLKALGFFVNRHGR